MLAVTTREEQCNLPTVTIIAVHLIVKSAVVSKKGATLECNKVGRQKQQKQKKGNMTPSRRCTREQKGFKKNKAAEGANLLAVCGCVWSVPCGLIWSGHCLQHHLHLESNLSAGCPPRLMGGDHPLPHQPVLQRLPQLQASQPGSASEVAQPAVSVLPVPSMLSILPACSA